MDRLSLGALTVYRGLVRHEPRFVPWFRTASPEPELSTLKIGSRPSRRRKGGGVESLRAIPWVFAWTQTRLLLPSWLGVDALAEGDPERLAEMAESWPFFDATLGLVEMVLAKARLPIAAHYEERLVPDELRDLGDGVRARLQKTITAVEAVRGKSLLSDNPVLARSIAVRNPYVDPLNLLQAELLVRFRADPHEGLEDALKVTINGIAAGMRNTG
jgi:phosphoenolpyruvate carboxylase